MYYTFWKQKFLCNLWSLALVKKSCNNINNRRAQVFRLCYFLWLWFNTPKNESASDHGDHGLLISNTGFEFQRIKIFLGLQLEKGIDYSSMQNVVWACHFVSGRKILSSLLDKCKRKTWVLSHTIDALKLWKCSNTKNFRKYFDWKRE